MTASEFSAWVKGINLVLNGHPPPPELWKAIVEEASKLTSIPGTKITSPVVTQKYLDEFEKAKVPMDSISDFAKKWAQSNIVPRNGREAN